ncbi:MAG: type IIL restriction-modification enzyme MmeI [Bulleidia sp.]|nr:type IIL restriction-modification enzyme MmeI [Bulleidia sp.]
MVIPIDFLDSETIPTDSATIIEGAREYEFGVLTSNVHMAWMRTVAGRLKSDYRYSKDIVYNNFPWPSPTGEQKAKIEQTAQGILDARALYPNSSLADLYDPLTMPPELQKAHIANDKAVMQAYGFSIKDTSEADCVAALIKMYQELTAEKEK